MKNFVKYTSIGLLSSVIFLGFSINLSAQNDTSETHEIQSKIIVGAENTTNYLSKLKGKKIGLISNQTGIATVNGITMHTVDLFLKNNLNVVKLYSPEHGFRGDADAGAKVKSGVDAKTGLPIISLYGDNKKPKANQISDVDILVFDMQDVGARFYTYISTLHYVMEAAAENGKKVIVLDRPNPNGHYVDGPVMKNEFKSFVGMHNVPIVYGMTIGEYAQMINGEGWLVNGIKADLEVIPLVYYTHQSRYNLPVKPSPNLPNAHAINLYPSTCLFEGTNVNEGRGTDMQFQVYGSPFLKNMPFQYTPISKPGASNPKFKDQVCFGEDLSEVPYQSAINLKWLINAYKNNTKQPFWTMNGKKLWIDQLSGTDELRKQIEAGLSEEEIKATWLKELETFKTIRAKYLIYKD
ncbi:exo-beta-N-acetylmuramidase NamZ family protein [Empedobacter brevis]|uniref:exo-beta-N-acetylmuramidase NamZ family protein n=1 Tax=Empedobacter brevis TaxID=247 RepID=UPI003342B141